MELLISRVGECTCFGEMRELRFCSSLLKDRICCPGICILEQDAFFKDKKEKLVEIIFFQRVIPASLKTTCKGPAYRIAGIPVSLKTCRFGFRSLNFYQTEFIVEFTFRNTRVDFCKSVVIDTGPSLR